MRGGQACRPARPDRMSRRGKDVPPGRCAWPGGGRGEEAAGGHPGTARVTVLQGEELSGARPADRAPCSRVLGEGGNRTHAGGRAMCGPGAGTDRDAPRCRRGSCAGHRAPPRGDRASRGAAGDPEQSGRSAVGGCGQLQDPAVRGVAMKVPAVAAGRARAVLAAEAG